MRAKVEAWDGASWNEIHTNYYRYYKDNVDPGLRHGLKLAFRAEAYARLKAALGSTDLDDASVSDAQVSPYADHYFQYPGSANRQITREEMDGGSRVHTFGYDTNPSGIEGYNRWKTKTTERWLDAGGGQIRKQTVYANYVGQVMLKDLTDDDGINPNPWIEYLKYNSSGRLIEKAHPSAVTDYDDSQDDLDVTLKANDGLIEVFDRFGVDVRSARVKQGSSGEAIKLRSYEYTSRLAGGVTIRPLSKETVYPDGWLAHWPLEEASGFVRWDLIGGNTLQENPPFMGQVTGRVGNAADFDGSHYLSDSNFTIGGLSPGANDFSVSLWVYLDSITGVRTLTGIWKEHSDNREYRVGYEGPGKKNFFFEISRDGKSGTVERVDANAFGVAAINTWYHVVAQHDATNDKMSIRVAEGTTVETDTITKSASGGPYQGAGDFLLGASIDASGPSGAAMEFLDGRLDELAFWPRLLTDAEVLALSDSGNAGKPHTGESDTLYSYTWFSGGTQMEERVTTLPAVLSAQNGSGTAVTRTERFDKHGKLIWLKDERGYITRHKYDVVTGALTQTIEDVDTTTTTDEPAGWVSPSGDPLHLVTDYTSDELGRITEELGPTHNIDSTNVRTATWTVYKEAQATPEVLTGRGSLAGSTYTLINPVSITKLDKDGRTIDEIQSKRSTGTGKLSATDTFAQTDWTRWTKHNYDDSGHLEWTRVYHAIPDSADGAKGTNYEQTDFGYDEFGRQDRIQAPGGTITRTVFDDIRDQESSIWVGTDDDPDTGEWSTAESAGTNLKKVTEFVYDSTIDGGDGNLTKETRYVDSTPTTRVTNYAFDWRNRQVTEDGELDFFVKQHYDNRDVVVRLERYNATESPGNLVGRTETEYDNRGSVYQTVLYAVDPTDGTVGNALVDKSGMTRRATRSSSGPPAGRPLPRPFTIDWAARRSDLSATTRPRQATRTPAPLRVTPSSSRSTRTTTTLVTPHC